jgi:hypothetical protein
MAWSLTQHRNRYISAKHMFLIFFTSAIVVKCDIIRPERDSNNSAASIAEVAHD